MEESVRGRLDTGIGGRTPWLEVFVLISLVLVACRRSGKSRRKKESKVESESESESIRMKGKERE